MNDKNLIFSRFIKAAFTLLMLPLLVAAQQTSDKPGYAPPGKLVDVGGWRLHLNCTGDNKGNKPTVVLESGSGDFSLDWSLVQPDVARFTRVCSYDRAGSAWSDLGPRPRTMKQVAYELHTALKKAGINGPYVMAGQSIGGMFVRVFANQYPDEVAGIVLVDSTHEDNQFFMNGKLQRMRELSSGRPIPPAQTRISEADKQLSVEQRQKFEELLKTDAKPEISPPYDKLPQEIQKQRLWALSRPERFEADNDPYFGEEFAEIYAHRQAHKYPLGDRPLIVLTRGLMEYPDSEMGKQLNEDRKRMQADLVQLSRNSKQIIAEKSGHHIQLDDPKLVVDAIRQVVDAAVRHAKLKQ